MEGISEKIYIMEQGFRLPHKWRDNLGISSRLWSQRDVDTDHLTLQTDGILLVVPGEVMSGGGVLSGSLAIILMLLTAIWHKLLVLVNEGELAASHPCSISFLRRLLSWFTLIHLTISVLARTASSVLQEFGTISRRYSWGTRLTRTHSHSPRKRNQIRGKTIG